MTLNQNNSTLREMYFLGSLPGTIDERDLRKYLETFGELISLELVRRKKTKLCKGYGFVALNLYVTRESFVAGPHNFQGRSIIVKSYTQGSELSQKKHDFAARRLFIREIPPWITGEDLKQYFLQFGGIEIAYVAQNYGPKKEKNLIGFVNFQEEQALNKALQSKDHLVNGAQICCFPFVTKLTKRNQKESSLENLDSVDREEKTPQADRIEGKGTLEDLNFRGFSVERSVRNTQRSLIPETPLTTAENLGSTSNLPNQTKRRLGHPKTAEVIKEGVLRKKMPKIGRLLREINPSKLNQRHFDENLRFNLNCNC